MKNKMFSFIRKKVAFKLALTVAIAIALVQVTFSYIEVISIKKSLETNLNESRTTLTDIASNSFVNGVWTYNQESVESIAESLVKNKEIAGIEVVDALIGSIYTFNKSGKEYLTNNLTKNSAPIFYGDKKIGDVNITFTDYYLLDSVRRNTLSKILEALATTVLMIGAILLGTHKITDSIKILSSGTDEIATGNLDKQIEIKSNDEIGELANKFNRMTKNLYHIMQDREKVLVSLTLSEEALQQANQQLEVQVKDRTKALHELNDTLLESNAELVETLNALKSTQTQLIQSEKLSGLATLVAGVAHEINTPLGISITAISFLNDQVSQFEALYNTNAIKRQDLESHLEQSKEVIAMIVNNLDRASKLVNSFKQVSIDQSTENKRKFMVKAYLDQLLLSLHPRIKKSSQTVNIHCPETLEIDSYPGAFAQIITNLVINSLSHAYEPETPGSIEITLTSDEKSLQILYTDDGSGMDAEVRGKIFTPFFTTNRQAGNTGLGLHITYNIVTLQLNGSIVCESTPNKGTQFIITLPITT